MASKKELEDYIRNLEIRVKYLEDIHPVTRRLFREYRTHKPSVVLTERAGEVTLEELVKLIIDGTPLKRNRVTTEEVKPLCCEMPNTKSGIIEETKE
jgi:hypothetical protein